jgi:hypothetical protein
VDALVRGPAGRAREVVQGCSLLWRRALLGRGP